MGPRLAAACIGGILAAGLIWGLTKGTSEPTQAIVPVPAVSAETVALTPDLSTPESTDPSLPPTDATAREEARVLVEGMLILYRSGTSPDRPR